MSSSIAEVVFTPIEGCSAWSCRAPFSYGPYFEHEHERFQIFCVIKEGFAREVGDRILFVDDGRILEQGAPADVFEHPREERTRIFLSKVL